MRKKLLNNVRPQTRRRHSRHSLVWISSVIPNAEAWNWLAPGGVTQKTNHKAPTTLSSADQPWLVVNRDPQVRHQNNVCVAYDDFRGAPDASRGGTGHQSSGLDPRSAHGVFHGPCEPWPSLGCRPTRGLHQHSVPAPHRARGRRVTKHQLHAQPRRRQWPAELEPERERDWHCADSTQPQPKFGPSGSLSSGYSVGPPPNASEDPECL
jgi:hypothetical protein